jgi:hypothetical protein
MTLILLAYIFALHWLIYRMHRRQRFHESVTLAVCRILKPLGTPGTPGAPGASERLEDLEIPKKVH